MASKLVDDKSLQVILEGLKHHFDNYAEDEDVIARTLSQSNDNDAVTARALVNLNKRVSAVENKKSNNGGSNGSTNKHQVIVRRAIPETPNPNHTYFFQGKYVRFKVKDSANREKILQAAIALQKSIQIVENPSSGSYTPIIDMGVSPIIVNPIYDGDHLDYMATLSSAKSNANFTSETASPYIRVVEGRLICNKVAEVEFYEGENGIHLTRSWKRKNAIYRKARRRYQDANKRKIKSWLRCTFKERETTKKDVNTKRKLDAGRRYRVFSIHRKVKSSIAREVFISPEIKKDGAYKVRA